MKEIETTVLQPEDEKQKGFTLIEMVAVIVVMGILAAVALPKFVGIQGEARAAAVQGARGSLSSAALMAHSKMLAANSMFPTINGHTFAMGDWAAHYPKGTPVGFLAGLNDWAGTASDGWQIILPGAQVGTATGAPTLGASETAWGPASASAKNVSGCYVSYTEAYLDANNIIVDPVLTVVNGGCAATGM